MSTFIAIDPRLQVSADAFANAWNAEPACQAVAHAEVKPAPGVHYDPLLSATILLGATIASGIATNALYDLIKLALIREGVTKRTRIETLEQPDGTKLTIVTIEES